MASTSSSSTTSSSTSSATFRKKSSTMQKIRTAGKRRMDTDVIKLMSNRHEVQLVNNMSEFIVKFHGPKGTAYENGVWKIRVDIPEKYPFKSPSIGFMNKIFHPNIDEASGTVCLDVINQSWTPLYELTNIFDSFLPQLLTYPNAQDPLNGEAASLWIHKPEEFTKRCKEYVDRYASEREFESFKPENSQIAPPPPKKFRGWDGKSASENDTDDDNEDQLSEYDPNDFDVEADFAAFCAQRKAEETANLEEQKEPEEQQGEPEEERMEF